MPPEQNPPESTNRLKAKAISDGIIASWGQLLKARANPTDRPEILYHFTDASGLAGILGDRAIRASLVTSLNDCSEIRYGVELATKLIATRMASRPSAFWEAAHHFLGDPTQPEGGAIDVPAFVVSLCGDFRKSVHWLHYGQAGKGAAIGFDSRASLPSAFDLIRVEYAPEEQERAILGFLDKTEEILASSEFDATTSRMAGHLFSVLLRVLAAHFKDPCFREEEEWRLITLQIQADRVPRLASEKPPMTKYRAVDGRVVPYEETPLSPENLAAVRSVVLGHSSPMQKDDQGLRMLLRSANPKAIIERSTVPVR
jgi:hypothetical protein